jgi:hypothetical protein
MQPGQTGLTRRAFVRAMVAMAPGTEHDGLWLTERAKLIFRVGMCVCRLI